MLQISKPSKNRVDILLSGVLDADAMREGLDDLVQQSQNVSEGRMLYRIADFEFPTLGALAQEFIQMPRLFGLLGHFEKCAVVSDAAWIRTAAEIEGAVIPSLKIRSFAESEIGAAEEWLDDTEASSNATDFENFPL